MHRCILVVLSLVTAVIAGPEEAEDLLNAAGKGEIDRLDALIDEGIDIDETSPFGVTALSIAADRGHLDVVKWLLAHGADVNISDGVYGYTPADRAEHRGHLDILQVLAENGAKVSEDVLLRAARVGHVGLVKGILKNLNRHSESPARLLSYALAEAEVAGHADLAHLLKNAGAKPLPAPSHPLPPEKQAIYAGSYHSRYLGSPVTFRPFGAYMKGKFPDQPEYTFRALTDRTITAIEVPDITFVFYVKDGRCEYTMLRQGGQEVRYEPVGTPPNRASYPNIPDRSTVEDRPKPVEKPLDWPQFRGPRAAGVADGQHPPIHWNVETGHNIRWKTPIPGLGHASPILWGDRIFILTAVKDSGEADFEFGPFEHTAVVSDNDEPHTWRLLCLRKGDGGVIWDRVVHQGVPRVSRLRKWSHANSTPATDGKHIVVIAGSGGLFCYDFDGELLWEKDLGVLNAGWFYDPHYQWGFGSSPIIHDGMVIAQCDRQEDSFIAAYDVKTGEPRWNWLRREYPSWSTPTIVESEGRTQVVTNGSRAIRGYEADTGKLLWIMEGESRISIPTPVFADPYIIVTSGYEPLKPIYSIRPNAEGNITLAPRADANQYVAWRKGRRGVFTTTPLAYRDHLYLLRDYGAMICADEDKGRLVGALQLGGCGSWTASPVAADGRLYFISEEGEVFVTETVKDNAIEPLALNFMGEPCLATPAISDGMIFIRTIHHLYAIGHTPSGGKDTPEDKAPKDEASDESS